MYRVLYYNTKFEYCLIPCKYNTKTFAYLASYVGMWGGMGGGMTPPRRPKFSDPPMFLEKILKIFKPFLMKILMMERKFCPNSPWFL